MPVTEDSPEISELRRRLDMYELIFESIYNGAMVTDADGIITHFNQPYGDFLGVDPDAQIGRHCRDAIENSRMHIVARTGKAGDQPVASHQRAKHGGAANSHQKERDGRLPSSGK